MPQIICQSLHPFSLSSLGEEHNKTLMFFNRTQFHIEKKKIIHSRRVTMHISVEQNESKSVWWHF